MAGHEHMDMILLAAKLNQPRQNALPEAKSDPDLSWLNQPRQNACRFDGASRQGVSRL
jgi:hypothetical protein